jgi:acyl carrier protein
MREKVVGIVSQILEVPPETVTDDLSPEKVETWDSLRHMDLVMALEEEFGIRFSDERILELLNFKVIVEAVAELAPKPRA